MFDKEDYRSLAAWIMKRPVRVSTTMAADKKTGKAAGNAGNGYKGNTQHSFCWARKLSFPEHDVWLVVNIQGDGYHYPTVNERYLPITQIPLCLSALSRLFQDLPSRFQDPTQLLQ